MRKLPATGPLPVLPIAIALAMSGCAVGPDYKQPVLNLDSTFIGAGASRINEQEPSADIAAFWRGFDDPILTDLVQKAVAANGDVRMAQARLKEAQANQSGTRASFFPEVDVTGGASRTLVPEYQVPGSTRGQRTNNAFDASFVANWELDFFGRNRRANEGSTARVEAGEAGVHAAQTVVAAEVARNYLELRGLQQRYEVALRSLANQQNTLKLTSSRLNAGRGTQLDVVRARSLSASTEAAMPVLQSAVERAAFRIATLSAQPSRVTLERLSTPQTLPSLPATDLGSLALGTPSQLLRRRPDLILAERQLAASSADIGVATADLFPRISLTGLLGFASDRVSQLGSRNSQQGAFGAALSWPVLDFGRVRARVGSTEARTNEALAFYEMAVATALEELEGSLSQFTRSAQQADRLASATQDAEEATRLSRIRFDAGAADLLVVLDAERQALVSRDALVQAQVAQATSLVSIYRSLGGGWASSHSEP